MTSLISQPSWLDAALEFCIAKTRNNLATLESFPERTEGGHWVQIDHDRHGWWVGGHWVGLLWLTYAVTGHRSLEAVACDWANYLLPQWNDQADHALGFLFELGFILGYQLTGKKNLKPPALEAALILSRRFNPRGQFIQAWGSILILPHCAPTLNAPHPFSTPSPLGDGVDWLT